MLEAEAVFKVKATFEAEEAAWRFPKLGVDMGGIIDMGNSSEESERNMSSGDGSR